MKVCLITDVLSPQTGWGRYSAEIISGLLDAGVECRILSPRSRCTYPRLAAHPDHHPISSFMEDSRHAGRLFAANHARVRRALAGCDLAHCLTEPYAPLTWLAGPRRPYVLSAVGTYAVQPLSQRIGGWFHRHAYRNAAAVACISEYTQRRLLRRMTLRDTEVVPLGVNLEEFELQQPVEPLDHPAILSVGMVKERKGIHVAIRAMAKVVQRHPDAHYYVVGPQEQSSYFARLQELIAELNLGRSVTFLGEVSEEELVQWYHRCTLFTLPSLTLGDQFEGFGLVHLEANACGKPAIGTWESGIEEVIVDGENGFLVPQRDAVALADSIERLLDDPALAKRMGAAGRARAEQMTWQRTVEKLIALYERVLAEHSTGGQAQHRSGAPT